MPDLAPLSPRALALAQTFVRMDTVSAHSNLPLIHAIRDELQRLGVRPRLTFNADKTKANLFATLGEGKPAGVILSGHTDTVPWDGQDWTLDPLSGEVRDGKLYGRGSADMKSFIALAVANAEAFLSSDAPFAVHFAFSYEEEIGCFGVRELIADLRDAGIKPLACIVGEPTSMVPAIAHKGVYRYKCCVRGKEAHSSLTPQSVNAIEMAARLVGKVRDMAEGFEREEPRYEGFDVPFSTASVGQFHGGIADNVVPRDAEFRYEFRDLPTADAKAMQAQVIAHARSLEPAMQKVAARSPASWARRRTPSHVWPCGWRGNSAPPTWRSAPKPGCSRTPASPPWCAARAASCRPTSLTSTSASTSWPAARPSCKGWPPRARSAEPASRGAAR
jgi:acetylornithine deacetylase